MPSPGEGLQANGIVCNRSELPLPWLSRMLIPSLLAIARSGLPSLLNRQLQSVAASEVVPVLWLAGA